MSDEKRALTRHSAPPSEADYEAILDAVMETGRGRWFLHEFAHRNRHSETRGVLTAIQRIEGLLRTQGGEQLGGDALEHAGSVSSDQIGAAIARAQEMLRAGGTSEAAFDHTIEALETAQVRIRAAATRVQDVAYMLREDGGQTRICNDLDRHSSELNTGSAQLDDAAGDIRILVALLKDIESQIGVSSAAQSHKAHAPVMDMAVMDMAVTDVPVASVVKPAAIVAEDAAVEDIAVEDLAVEGLVAVANAEIAAPVAEPEAAPEPQALHVQTLHVQTLHADVAMPSPPAKFESADVEIADVAPVTSSAATSPANNSAAAYVAGLAVAQAASAAPPVPVSLAAPISAPLPADLQQPYVPSDPVAGPADFLLEPFEDDFEDTPQAQSAPPARAPAEPLRLDSFDPLAPIRALSDEEKVALFS